MALSPGPSSFGEYLKRVSHVIALQGIFGILLLFTRQLPDRSMALVVRGREVLTLLDINSLAVFALFLVLSIAVFRQESDGALEEGDPFLRVLEGYGSPSGSTTLFRVVHAIFSVVMVLVYLTETETPLVPSLRQEAGIVVLFIIAIFSSRSVSLAVSRFVDHTMGGVRRAFACLIYLLGLGLIFGGAISGVQNLLIAGMVVISFEILYVVVREDRRVRSGESSRDS
jgi:hypothetical protein